MGVGGRKEKGSGERRGSREWEGKVKEEEDNKDQASRQTDNKTVHAPEYTQTYIS